jgi:threonine dehydrogenase-like Zn-dependent dehydrogenase
MGIVLETGSGVSLLKKGDRVVMPFNVADGRCRNCQLVEQLFQFMKKGKMIQVVCCSTVKWSPYL